MIIFSFTFLKWGANTELTTQPESPGQRARKQGMRSLPVPPYRLVQHNRTKNGIRMEKWKDSKSSNLTASTTFYLVLPGHCLAFEAKGLQDVLPKCFPFCSHRTLLVLVTEAEAVPCHAHLYKPSRCLLPVDTCSTHLSHIENVPSHFCQMQGLKKEVTFILELYKELF